MNSPVYTIAEVAERLGVEVEAARGAVKFLVSAGIAQDRGKRRPEGGRGASASVYSFTEGYATRAAEIFTAAKLA